MRKVSFNYRPDGDLNEYIPNLKAQEIVSKARKGRWENGLQAIREAREMVMYVEFDIEVDYKECSDAQKQQYKKWKQENKAEWHEYVKAEKAEIKDANYRIERKGGAAYQDRTTHFWSITENIEVVLTNRTVQSRPVMEGESWGGVSDDRCQAYIIYHNEDEMNGKWKFIGKNTLADSVTLQLIEKGIAYEETPISWLNSLNSNASTQIAYKRNGQQRYIFETWHRIAIDDVVAISVAFEADVPPEKQVVIDAINRKY